MCQKDGKIIVRGCCGDQENKLDNLWRISSSLAFEFGGLGMPATSGCL